MIVELRNRPGISEDSDTGHIYITNDLSKNKYNQTDGRLYRPLDSTAGMFDGCGALVRPDLSEQSDIKQRSNWLSSLEGNDPECTRDIPPPEPGTGCAITASIEITSQEFFQYPKGWTDYTITLSESSTKDVFISMSSDYEFKDGQSKKWYDLIISSESSMDITIPPGNLTFSGRVYNDELLIDPIEERGYILAIDEVICSEVCDLTHTWTNIDGDDTATTCFIIKNKVSTYSLGVENVVYGQFDTMLDECSNGVPRGTRNTNETRETLQSVDLKYTADDNPILSLAHARVPYLSAGGCWDGAPPNTVKEYTRLFDKFVLLSIVSQTSATVIMNGFNITENTSPSGSCSTPHCEWADDFNQLIGEIMFPKLIIYDELIGDVKSFW